MLEQREVSTDTAPVSADADAHADADADADVTSTQHNFSTILSFGHSGLVSCSPVIVVDYSTLTVASKGTTTRQYLRFSAEEVASLKQICFRGAIKAHITGSAAIGADTLLDRSVATAALREVTTKKCPTCGFPDTHYHGAAACEQRKRICENGLRRACASAAVWGYSCEAE